MPDRSFLTHVLQELVRINSINPQLVDGAPGEKEISRFIYDILNGLGIPAEMEEIAPDRYNVTAVIKGSGKGKSLVINAHTDTVGIAHMTDPFSGTITNGRLYGRGSMDMKGSIAAMLAMAQHIAENNITLQGDLILSFVADEEFGSIGTEHFLKDHTADAAIVTEPTSLDICLAHKGFGLYEMTTTGKAAHGGRPDLGVDANMHMGQILAKLDKLSETLKKTSPHPLLGVPSLHVPVINGGSEPFTYAGACNIKVERRTLPGETNEAIMATFNNIIDELSQQDKDFKAAVKCTIWRDAFEADQSSSIVSSLSESVHKVRKREPSYIGHHWWEDSGLFGQAGIDTVIIGPHGEGLHTTTEWVDIESVAQLSEILMQTAQQFCN
ncbi:MAG: ArgE/DapE family deacylase [Balneolaceae bacterium]|nr:ArgE/DapE family deacylase [Balneolaceae bacterium]